MHLSQCYRAYLIMLIILYLLQATTCALVRIPQIMSDAVIKTHRQSMLNLINKARKASNKSLAKLYLDDALNFLAEKHSIDMVKRNYFDHLNPDGRTPGIRAKLVGFNYLVGQNFAIGNNISQIHNILMKSSDNYNNTINPKWTRCGIGFQYDLNKEIYTTILFSVRDLKANPISQNQLIKVQTQIVKYILDLNRQLKSEDKGLSFIIKKWYAIGTSGKKTIMDFMKMIKYTKPGVTYLSSKAKIQWSDNLVQKMRQAQTFKQKNTNFTKFGVNLKAKDNIAQIVVVFATK